MSYVSKWISFKTTSSRLNCKSLFSSISLNTFVVGGESPIFMSSTSNKRVAPPGRKTTVLIKSLQINDRDKWLKLEIQTWYNISSASVAVSKAGRDCQFSFFAWNFEKKLHPILKFHKLGDITDTHVKKSLVPSFNHLPSTKLECKRLISVITGKNKQIWVVLTSKNKLIRHATDDWNAGW